MHEAYQDPEGTGWALLLDVLTFDQFKEKSILEMGIPKKYVQVTDEQWQIRYDSYLQDQRANMMRQAEEPIGEKYPRIVEQRRVQKYR